MTEACEPAAPPPWEAWRRALPRPARPMAPLRWYGGKGNLLGFVLPVLRAAGVGAEVYCEPYFGGGSLFFAKAPHPVECINDKDERLIGLYRVLQDRAAAEALIHRLTFTPYSRAEFARALSLRDDPDPVTAAWALFVCQGQGFSGRANSVGNWSVCRERKAKPQKKMLSRLRLLHEWHDRLMHASVECRCALHVLRQWDSPATLFYLDPPYPAATRAKGSDSEYRHEADDAHHAALLALLPRLAGRVVLSGYPNAAYDQALAGWRKLERQTACHAAGRGRGSGLTGAGAAKAKVARTEVLWLNPAAAAASGMLDL